MTIILLGMVYTFSYVYEWKNGEHDGKEVTIACMKALVWPYTLGMDKKENK